MTPKTDAQELTLKHLTDNEWSTAREVQDATGKTRAAIRSALTALERQGLIAKQEVDGFWKYRVTPLSRSEPLPVPAYNAPKAPTMALGRRPFSAEAYTCPELSRNPGLPDSRFDAFKLPSLINGRVVYPQRTA